MTWRFKQEYGDAIISIPAIRLTLTKFNITDERVEMILKKYPQFAHNFERVTEDEQPRARVSRSRGRKKFIE